MVQRIARERLAGPPAVLSAAGVAALLRPGLRVYVQGLASEPLALREALVADGQAAQAVHWHGVLVPGINRFDYAAAASQARFTGLFIGPDQAATAADGRTELLPIHYSQAYRHFAGQAFDLVILQVAPPDQDGLCSLGINADFAEAVAARASRVLAYVNRQMPRTQGPAIAWAALDYVVPVDGELLRAPSTEPADAVTDRLARHVAGLVRDGDCLQLGIGKIPAAVLPLLANHRRLGMHSGLVTDGARVLLEAGALTGERKQIDRGRIVTNAVYGGAQLYDLAGREPFAFRSVAYTHASYVVARIDDFVSVNSAVEVDLSGQVNAESVAGRQISGTGGAVDFARAAAMSRGGRAIVALPSLTASGRSRIVASLAAGTPVTCARSDVGIVVTEHGAADLRGLASRARAQALLGIADPSVRNGLEREFFP